MSAAPPSLTSLPAWARQALDRILSGRPTPLDRLWADPGGLMARAGTPPYPWQAGVLLSPARRLLLLCSRQSGKSLVAAALALLTALLQPGSLTLLLSPTLRQSGELFRDNVLRLYAAVSALMPSTQETALQLTLANGSRIISL